MIAFRIEDRKKFTSELFIGQLFDRFWVKEAVFVTFSTFSIDGRTRKGYYTAEELEDGRAGEYADWAALKPFCYSLIRGKRLPERFQIVFQLPSEQTEKFLTAGGMARTQEQTPGLYLNVRYGQGNIDCVTGTAAGVFTMDKSLERAWDQAVADYFRKKEIPFVTDRERDGI